VQSQAAVGRVVRSTAALAFAGLTLAGTAYAAPSDQYVVRNLVSSSAAVPADRFDLNLVNPRSTWASRSR
jgi:hypothetical protein